MVVLMFLSGSCIHLNGKPWCNAKASVFKVIFYLAYLFILTRNVFCCSHSWQLKQQNTKPVQDDLICTCQHDRSFQSESTTASAAVSFSVTFNEKMGGGYQKWCHQGLIFQTTFTVSRFPGNRQPPGKGENSSWLWFLLPSIRTRQTDGEGEDKGLNCVAIQKWERQKDNQPADVFSLTYSPVTDGEKEVQP